MSAGRPTDYKEEYCQELIDHMAAGYSFESFAGLIGVARSTIYKWAEDVPQFSDAKNAAFEQSRLFWEKQGIKGLYEGINATLWIFNMKNRFPEQWRDKQEIEQNSNVNLSGGVSINWPEAD